MSRNGKDEMAQSVHDVNEGLSVALYSEYWKMVDFSEDRLEWDTI